MTTVSKSKIQKAQDRPREDVNVPEWGGKVTVQAMSDLERGEFEYECGLVDRPDGNDVRGFRVRLVQRSVVNGDGKLMFSSDDINWLQHKSGAVLSRIADVAMRLSGFSKQDVEELAGNLPTTPEDSSGSG